MKAIQIAMKHILLPSIFFSIALFVFAQQPGRAPGGQMPLGSISGSVSDETGSQALEFATVALYKAQDSSLVGGGITDVKGNFSVQARPGQYYLKIAFIGYGEKFISGISIGRDNMNVELGAVQLTTSDVQLDEVTVEAERTQMELQLDKKVYNIGKDLSNLGGSASDLLANLPSVQVDVDGNVQLRGSENVQILIDGRPSSLVGLSGSGGLQQLQGNLIERVEIITNPSARYDAEGGAGIINIILKKEKAKGFNGSFQVQTGYPANHGASVNVNYRTGWINWFVNYGLTYRENPGQGFNNQFFPTDPDTAYTDIINKRNRTGFSQNVRFGSDIYLNDNNIITLSASHRTSDNDNFTQVNYNEFDLSRDFLRFRRRIENQNELDDNWQYAINYTRNFRKKGQKLTVDYQYQDNGEVELSDFNEIIRSPLDPELTEFQNSSNDNGEVVALIQMDYTQPFGKSGLIETGIRYNSRKIFNDYFVEEEVTPGNFQEDPNLSNEYNFDEKVTAAYFIISNKLDRFNWQIGNRIEQTNLQTLLIQGNERNNQNYLSFFPSANVSYKLLETRSVQLSYSRRISRPSFRSLNPFVNISDDKNYYVGNPQLQPQFTDSYELGILENKEKSSIYFGVYYRLTTDVVQRLLERDEATGINIRRPENLAQEDAIGLELNLTHDFNKAFRSTANMNFYNSQITGIFPANTTTFTTRIANYYRNDRLFNAQLSLWYSAPQNTPQGKRFSIASLDFGLSKDVLKKNGTIALNAQDLLNSRKYRGITNLPTLESESEFQWRRGPTITASFTYRINQQKGRERRDRVRDESGLREEGEF